MHPVHPHPQKGLRQHRPMKAAAQIALVPLCGIALTNKTKDLRRAAQVLSYSLVSSAQNASTVGSRSVSGYS